MKFDDQDFINNYKDDDFSFKRLQELEQETDWDSLVEAIFPFYVNSKISHVSVTVENMLRIYFILRFFEMTPSGVEKALNEIESLREFALIDIEKESIPDAASISEFISILFEESLMLKIERALKGGWPETKHSVEF